MIKYALIYFIIFFHGLAHSANLVIQEVRNNITDNGSVSFLGVVLSGFKYNSYTTSFLLKNQPTGGKTVITSEPESDHYILEVMVENIFRTLNLGGIQSVAVITYTVTSQDKNQKWKKTYQTVGSGKITDSLIFHTRVGISDESAVRESLRIFTDEFTEYLAKTPTFKPMAYVLDPLSGKLGVHNTHRSANIIQWEEIENTIATSTTGKVYRSRRSKNIGDCTENLQAIQSLTNFQRTEAQGRGDKVEDNLNIVFGADLKRICGRTDFKESIELLESLLDLPKMGAWHQNVMQQKQTFLEFLSA
jgi:hypothetical protein